MLLGPRSALKTRRARLDTEGVHHVAVASEADAAVTRVVWVQLPAATPRRWSQLAWTAARQAVSKWDRNPSPAPRVRAQGATRSPKPRSEGRFLAGPQTHRAGGVPGTTLAFQARGLGSSPSTRTSMTSSSSAQGRLQNCAGPVRFRRSSPRPLTFQGHV